MSMLVMLSKLAFVLR